MRENFPVQVLLNRLAENWRDAASPETEIMFCIIRFYELIREATDPVLAQFDLTPAAFEVLVALRAQPNPRQLTPTELYKSVLLSSGGTTKVLIGLEIKGLVERLANPQDGRSKIVRLTAAGEHLAERSMAAVMEQDKKHFSAFDKPAEIGELRNHILAVLQKIEGRPA